MVTRKSREEAQHMEQQHGAATALPQRGPRGTEKSKETVSKPPKTPKANAGDPPRGMRYYAQKLSGPPDPLESQEVEDVAKGEATEQEEVEGNLALDAITDQPEPPAERIEEREDGGDEEDEQPTLAEILRAVNRCTAVVNILQDCFGGLKEEVVLIKQDLQKNRVQKKNRGFKPLRDRFGRGANYLDPEEGQMFGSQKGADILGPAERQSCLNSEERQMVWVQKREGDFGCRTGKEVLGPEEGQGVWVHIRNRWVGFGRLIKVLGPEDRQRFWVQKWNSGFGCRRRTEGFSP